MNQALAALSGVAALHVFFRAVRANWPAAYFELDSSIEYALARSPIRYVAFRLGPVFLVSLFIACTLDRYNDDPSWSVAGAVALHLLTTSGRVIQEQLQALFANRVVRWPVVVLAVFVAAGSACSATLALLFRAPLSGLIPRPADLAAEVWGGAVAAVGAFYVLGLAKSGRSAAEDALSSARHDIPRELWCKAEDTAALYGVDVGLLKAVMTLENAQRPRWFRRLERIKGVIIKRGTYGIMQIYSSVPISDEDSIDKMADRLVGREVPNDDEGGERQQFFRSLALELNGRSSYGDDLCSLYQELEWGETDHHGGRARS